jgi:hypothetical protein
MPAVTGVQSWLKVDPVGYWRALDTFESCPNAISPIVISLSAMKRQQDPNLDRG